MDLFLVSSELFWQKGNQKESRLGLGDKQTSRERPPGKRANMEVSNSQKALPLPARGADLRLIWRWKCMTSTWVPGSVGKCGGVPIPFTESGSAYTLNTGCGAYLNPVATVVQEPPKIHTCCLLDTCGVLGRPHPLQPMLIRRVT